MTAAFTGSQPACSRVAEPASAALVARSRMSRRVAVALLIVAPLAAASAETSPAATIEDGPWVLRARGWTAGTLARVGERFDHVGVHRQKGILLVHADDLEDVLFLRQLGLLLEIDAARTAVLRRLELAFALGVDSIDAIPGFECYRTVEEIHAAGADLAAAYPELVEWVDIGDSWEKQNGPGAGYDLKLLRLTSSRIASHKPAFLVTATVHAREYATEVGTLLAELLASRYGTDPDVTWILDHHEVHILLVMNPDGRKEAETGLLWRKNVDNEWCTDTDNRGVDLNRNYDFEWEFNPAECSETFAGPSAVSEPEVAAVQAYAVALFPDQREDDLEDPAPLDAEGVFIDLHSSGEVMFGPWSFEVDGGHPPNEQGLRTLSRKVAFFPGYRSEAGSTGILHGTSKDFTYGRLGVPGYTLEMGTAFFEECSYFETRIVPGVLAGLVHAAKNVRTPYVTPSGPDAYGVAVAANPVARGDLVGVTATLDDTRYSTTGDPGTEPVSDIALGEIYVDTPSWQGGAAIGMAAADGAFDEAVEGVEATLDTTGLAPGRHTLFVRGRDTTSPVGPAFGAPAAAFLWVVDPASSPTLSGTVIDARTGDALAATVAIGPFTVETSPTTGAYMLQVPADTYEVTASAPGYGPQAVSITLADFDDELADFFLRPLVQLLADDVEAGNRGWTAQTPWAITAEVFFSPTHSWTDSPGGNYGNNVDASLTSPAFDLTHHHGARLSFRHIYDFEDGFDAGRVEVSPDGVAWTGVAIFTGEDQDGAWQLVELALPILDGAPQARVRFRVESDSGLTRDGWHLDDLRLEAANELFADGFESGGTSAWSAVVSN